MHLAWLLTAPKSVYFLPHVLHGTQVSSTMQPWAPTFAFDLQTDNSSEASTLPTFSTSKELDPTASSCCRASASLEGRKSDEGQLGTAQALLLDHPDLGVSGVRVDHRHHRVEVLSSSGTQVRDPPVSVNTGYPAEG